MSTSMAIKSRCLDISMTDSLMWQDIQSHVKSERYIKTMSKAAVLNIIYHRLNVQQEFKTKNYHGVNYSCFKGDTKHPFAQFYYDWVIAFEDALTKKFVKKFDLYLINEETRQVEECYTFTFRYSKSEKPLNVDLDVVEISKSLFKNLLSLGQLEKFNSAKVVPMIEFFYASYTPAYYQAPGCTDLRLENSLGAQVSKNENYKLNVCRINTGSHIFQCTAHGSKITEYQAKIPEVVIPDEDLALTPVPSVSLNNSTRDAEVLENSEYFLDEKYPEDFMRSPRTCNEDCMVIESENEKSFHSDIIEGGTDTLPSPLEELTDSQNFAKNFANSELLPSVSHPMYKRFFETIKHKRKLTSSTGFKQNKSPKMC